MYTAHCWYTSVCLDLLVGADIKRDPLLSPDPVEEGEILVSQQFLSQIVSTLHDHGHKSPAVKVTVGAGLPDPLDLLGPGLLEDGGAGVLGIPLEARLGLGRVDTLAQSPPDVPSLNKTSHYTGHTNIVFLSFHFPSTHEINLKLIIATSTTI